MIIILEIKLKMNCNNEETIDEDNYFGNNVGKIFNDANFNNFHYFNNEIDEEKGIYNHFLQNRNNFEIIEEEKNENK